MTAQTSTLRVNSIRHVATDFLSWCAAGFSNNGVRSGIKLAVACLLALWLALWFRLESPTWAVTTAFVLQSPKYVGAIAEKTLLRILGAVAGAFVGYLITGSLEQSPILFLGAMGLLLTFTTSMFGGTLAPYGFHQMGYTALLVASSGMANPSESWRIGIARCEEICLGIIVTAFVATLLWPRHARPEFQALVRRTLASLGDLLRTRADAFVSHARVTPQDVLGKVGGNLAAMRRLIDVGCAESRPFHERRAEIDEIVSQIGVVTAAVSNLAHSIPHESVINRHMEEPMRDLHGALLDVVEALTKEDAGDGRRTLLLDRAADSLAAYHDALLHVRADRDRESIPAEESFRQGGYGLSLREVHDALTRLAELLPHVESRREESFPAVRFRKPAMPPAEWIHGGLRGAIAVIAAMVFVNWQHPPGGEILIVGTYLFNAFSIATPDRMGDLGVFTMSTIAGVGCVIFGFFLLLTTPLMESYLVFNVIFGTMLFVMGFINETTRAGSFVRIAFLLVVVCMVDINAQEPVSFQAIVGVVFGIGMAALLSSLCRRLLWPNLPQRQLRRSLDRNLALLQAAAASPDKPLPLRARSDLALAVADTLDLVHVLRGSVLSDEQCRQLTGQLESLGRLGGHLTFCPGRLPTALPEEFRRDLLAELHGLAARVAAQLAWQRERLKGRDAPPPAAVDARAWAEQFCHRIRQAALPIPESTAAFGYIYRCEEAVEESATAVRIAAPIDYPRMFADWRL